MLYRSTSSLMVVHKYNQKYKVVFLKKVRQTSDVIPNMCTTFGQVSEPYNQSLHQIVPIFQDNVIFG